MPRKKKLETALENLLTPPVDNSRVVEPGSWEADPGPDSPGALVAADALAGAGEPAAPETPAVAPESPEIAALPDAPPVIAAAAPPPPAALAPPEGLEDAVATEVLAVDAIALEEEEEEAFTFAEETAEVAVEAAGGERQLVILMLADEWYGVNIAAVEQIIEFQRITPVPHTPAYIAGLTNLRGAVLPVVDLRRRLGLPTCEPTRETRIVVAQAHQMQVGMIVDAVTEVLRVPERAIEPPSPLVTPVDSLYITGIAKIADQEGARNAERLIVLLDLEQILPSVRGR